MKTKIKSYFKQFIDYTLTDEFRSIAMMFLSVIAILAICWGAIMTVLTEDLTNVVIERNKKITELENSIDYFRGEAARYKMISEEYYEQFYYNNVDQKSGKIEGEYYE